jgi:hypothetical protein
MWTGIVASGVKIARKMRQIDTVCGIGMVIAASLVHRSRQNFPIGAVIWRGETLAIPGALIPTADRFWTFVWLQGGFERPGMAAGASSPPPDSISLVE